MPESRAIGLGGAVAFVALEIALRGRFGDTPYQVVGFDRLVEAIVTKGGFSTNETPKNTA